MKQLLSFILSILLLTACTSGDDEATIAVLDRAEAYLPQYPDSAAALLDSIDTCDDSFQVVESFPHGGQLRNCSNRGAKRRKETGEWFPLYSLLRTMTDDMLHGITPTDSIIRHTYIYYKEQMDGKVFFLQSNTLKRRYARSAFYLARCLEQSDSIKAAEDLYRESSEYSRQAGDLHTCYNALYYLGRSVSLSDVSSGCQLLRQSLDIYSKCNDCMENHVSIVEELSYNYMTAENYDSAWYYLNEASDIVSKNNITTLYPQILRQTSNIHFSMGNYSDALSFAKQYLEQASELELESAKYVAADCFMACDSLKQAWQIYSQLVSSDDETTRYMSFRNLASIAAVSGQSELSCHYSDSAYQSLENMYYASLKTKADYYDFIIKKEKQQHKLQVKQIKSTACFIIILVILFFISICVLSYLIYNKYITKKNHEIEILEKNGVIEKQQSVLREQELLNETNKKLLHQKSIRLALMQQHFMTYLDNYKINLKDKGNLKMDEKSWEKMEEMLNMAEEDFVRVLRKNYPKFSENDIRLCMMVKLKLTNNQMANVLCIGDEAVKKRKQKLKVSGFSVTDPSIHLENILENI
ncbi:MAG: hypothetical protein IJ557_08270 [Bacteroidaceae bacterium]|nr:hypothetical protein [Bacteroidaceae bacterium]